MAISSNPQKMQQLQERLAAIGPQLQHYLAHVTAGTVDGNLHFSVYQQQLAPWLAMIAGILADPATLASLTAMYPYWTAGELQSVQASLQAIRGHLAPHLEPYNHGGAWRVHDVRSLTLSDADGAALRNVLAANLS